MPADFLAGLAAAPETTMAAITAIAPRITTDVPANFFTLVASVLDGRAPLRAQGGPPVARRPRRPKAGQSYSPRGIVQDPRAGQEIGYLSSCELPSKRVFVVRYCVTFARVTKFRPVFVSAGTTRPPL